MVCQLSWTEWMRKHEFPKGKRGRERKRRSEKNDARSENFESMPIVVCIEMLTQHQIVEKKWKEIKTKLGYNGLEENVCFFQFGERVL